MVSQVLKMEIDVFTYTLTVIQYLAYFSQKRGSGCKNERENHCASLCNFAGAVLPAGKGEAMVSAGRG